jgi:hypothetical protein
MDSYEEMIIPEVPKALPNEQLFIYAPIASDNTAGVAKFDNEYFSVDTDGTVHLQSLGKSGIITIPISEWSDTSPTVATAGFSGVDFKSIILMLPADEQTRLTANKAKLSAYPTASTPVFGSSSVTILRTEAETIPDSDMTFAYIILKAKFSFSSPVAAIVGIDAYGEGGGGTASGVDEDAVKKIINSMLGNVVNERQYSAENPPPYPVTSVNGQGGTVNLHIPGTAAEVGAEKAGAVNTHDTDPNAHGAVREDVTRLQQDLASIIGIDKNMTIRAIAALVIAEALKNAPESLNSLEEIAAWIEAHPGDVAAIVQRIVTLENDIKSKVNVGDIPKALPNPQAITILGKTYTGASAVSITIDDILAELPIYNGEVIEE